MIERIAEYENINFIILSIKGDFKKTRSTYKSILLRYPESSSSIVCSKGVTKKQIDELKEFTKVNKGKDSIVSLFNTGMRNTDKEWNVFVTEGVTVKPRLIENLNFFLKDKNEIIFPLTLDRNKKQKTTKVITNFFECNINGLMISKASYKSIGSFNIEYNQENSMIDWQLRGIEKGYQFKGVLGINIK